MVDGLLRDGAWKRELDGAGTSEAGQEEVRGTAAVASRALVPRPHSTGAVAAHGSASVAYSLTSALLSHWHRTGRIKPRDAAALLDAFSVSNAHGLATFRAFGERMRPQP